MAAGSGNGAAVRHLRLTRRGAQAAVAVGLAVFLAGLTLTAGASGDDPWPAVFEYGDEDPRSRTCDEVGADMVASGWLDSMPSWSTFEIEDPTVGDHGGPLGVVLSNLQNADDGPTSFDWESSAGADLVYVKSGSSGSRLYLYDPPEESTGGSGLGTDQQISHISFCYDEGAGSTTTSEPSTTTTTVAPSTTTSEPSTTTTTVAPQSTTSVPPKTTTSSVPGTTTTVVVRVLGENEELPATGGLVGLALMVAGGLLSIGGGAPWLAHRRNGSLGEAA